MPEKQPDEPTVEQSITLPDLLPAVYSIIARAEQFGNGTRVPYGIQRVVYVDKKTVVPTVLRIEDGPMLLPETPGTHILNHFASLQLKPNHFTGILQVFIDVGASYLSNLDRQLHIEVDTDGILLTGGYSDNQLKLVSYPLLPTGVPSGAITKNVASQFELLPTRINEMMTAIKSYCL